MNYNDAMFNFNYVYAMTSWLSTKGWHVILILAGAWIVNEIINRSLERAIRHMIKPDAFASPDAERKREDTLIHILNRTLSIVIYFIAFIMILAAIGINITPLIAGAGIVGLAVGLGAQQLIRDVIGGLFIVMENQYRIGDIVTLNGVSGMVEEITLRITALRDLDGTKHYIPNGAIVNASNLSKDFARVNINIGVSYTSDLQRVIETVNRVGEDLAKDPVFKKMIIKAPEFLRVEDFGDSAVVIKILGDVKPLKQWDVTGELRKRLKIAFDEAGIEIPFPQRVVHVAKTE
jgi:small-conductance mechanosensitive channel